MKSIINICCGKKELTFPRLMKSRVTGNIYLVNKSGGYYHDVVVSVGDKAAMFSIGDRGSSLTLSKNLEDYDGTVTLSNN